MLFLSSGVASGINHRNTTLTTMSANPTSSNSDIQPNSVLTQKNILLVACISGYFSPLQANLEADGNTVSTMLSTTTPTLSQLQAYDAIVLYVSCGGYTDPTTWGNVVADYLDGGGIVIEAPFTYSSGASLGGRFLSDGYGVFTIGVNDNLAKGYSGTSSHPIMAGISQYNATYAMLATLMPNAALVASYDDGTPFVAIRGNVVGFNSFLGAAGDGNATRIIENAINFLTPPPGGKNILLVACISGYFSPLQANLEADGNTVSTMLSTTTPTLADLQLYDAIVLYVSCGGYTDPTTWGNVVADYLDAGGIVIEAPFTYSSGASLGGRFLSDGYGVFTIGVNDNLAKGYSGTSSHPIMAGVSQYNATYAMLATLMPNAALVAAYDDGTPFVAVRGNVVGVNSFLGAAGDGNATRIIENAINFLTPPPGGKNILLVACISGYFSPLQANLEADGNTVSTMLSTTTPTLSQLQAYDAIALYVSCGGYTDPTTWGNVVADYLDAGGIVIEAPFTYSSGASLGGRFLSDGYGVFTIGVNDNLAKGYSGTSSHPIMAGVSQYNATYAMLATLVPNADLVSSYDDGTPFVAVHGNVVGVNSFLGAAGDGNATRIIENAINYATLSFDTIPVITSVGDQTIELGTTGNSITWPVSDDSPNAYSVTQDGVVVDSGSYSNSQNIVANIDGLSIGTYVFVLTINDTQSQSASDSVIITVVDTTSPTVNSPVDFSYNEGSTGNSISWTATDASPGTYSVVLDGSNYDSGTWTSGSAVVVNVDSLSLGSHTFTITFSDTQSHTVSDSVTVTVVDATSPTISSPADISYQEGQTGNAISWVASDDHASTYEIARDGSVVDQGNWVSGSAIEINVDGLGVGTYTFMLTVYDSAGNSNSDTVTVTVTAAPTSNNGGTSSHDTSSDNTSKDTSGGNPPGLPFPSLFIISLSIVGLSILKKKVIR